MPSTPLGGTGQKLTDSSRIGDIAEHYAVTFLWDEGYEVYRNAGCTGPIDIVARHMESGEILLIDVKSYKDGRLPARSNLQKLLGVRYLHFNSATREMRFVEHRE